jgi:hypothetical protein
VWSLGHGWPGLVEPLIVLVQMGLQGRETCSLLVSLSTVGVLFVFCMRPENCCFWHFLRAKLQTAISQQILDGFPLNFVDRILSTVSRCSSNIGA